MTTTRTMFAAGAIAAVTFMSGADIVGTADSPKAASYHYMYFDTVIELGLDPTFLAFWAPEASEIEALSFLSGLPLDASTLRRATVPGWFHVDVAEGSRDARSIDGIVRRMGRDEAFEFVTPVFLGEGGLPWMPTRDLLVGFEPGVDDGVPEALLATAGATILEADFAGLEGVYRARTAMRTGMEMLDLANGLANRPETRWAEPDAIAWFHSWYIPNDPQFPKQWALNQSSDMDMDAPEAWDVTFGDESIRVVVLDSGIQQDHPDIHQVPGQDFTGGGNTGGGPSSTCDNHGTAVAGCVAAAIDNGQGVVGIAPGCSVTSGKIFNEYVLFGICLPFLETQESWMINGITWTASSGARVTNSSWGGGSAMSGVTQAFNTTKAKGVVHFAAAGNDGTSTIGWPANLASVNAVAALASSGSLASFSTYGNGLFISAPGASVLTTDRTGSDGYASGNTATVDGTSFASPYAAGVAGLVVSMDTGQTPDEVAQVMADTAKDLGAGGYDTTYGWGFVSAGDAVDGFETGCEGDVTADGLVDVSDILAVLAAWGPCGGCDADVDGSGTVDVSDILAVLAAWGPCP